MSTNFYSLIHAALRQADHSPLLVWPAASPAQEPTTWTGPDLLARLSAIRAGLLGRGITAGQAVLVAVPVSADLIGAVLAVQSIGAIPVLPPPGRATTLAWLRLVRRHHIGTVILAQAPHGPYRWVMGRLGIGLLDLARLPAASPDWEPAPAPPDQAALVSYSSGSTTGHAKAVVRTHRVLRAQHEALKTSFPPWAGQRDFPLFPNVLLHNLATGAGVVSILPDLPWGDLPHLDPARLAAQLVHEQVQTLTGNVYYFRQLLPALRALAPATLDHVRAVGIGGSPVPESLLAEVRAAFPRAEVYVIYGSSEAEPIAVRRVTDEPLAPALGYCVGDVHPALTLQIREPLIEIELPGGLRRLVGEVSVRGAHVATEALGGWFRTGDFGYLDERSRLFLTGRRGNEQMHQKTQHYQLEHVLLTQPGVVQAAARSGPEGFTVYVQGDVADSVIRQSLAACFSPGICADPILYRAQLPVDSRHQSKIRYDQLR